jgi:uncharacterized protein (DUF4415 family)
MSAKRTPGSKTDWERVKAMRDEDIDMTDEPVMTPEMWAHAVPLRELTKTSVTLRLDTDILEWFKAQGPRYQTRINATLRRIVDGAKTVQTSKKPRVRK